jgi:hypothetical protein
MREGVKGGIRKDINCIKENVKVSKDPSMNGSFDIVSAIPIKMREMIRQLAVEDLAEHSVAAVAAL